MAKLAFPPTPIVGQIYVGDNKVSYQWDGSKWGTRLVESYAISGANPGVTPPANPTNGTFWWDSESGQLYVYYNDGDSQQWMQAALNGQVVDSSGNPVTGQSLSNTSTGIVGGIHIALDGNAYYDGIAFDAPVSLEHEQEVTITDSGNVEVS